MSKRFVILDDEIVMLSKPYSNKEEFQYLLKDLKKRHPEYFKDKDIAFRDNIFVSEFNDIPVNGIFECNEPVSNLNCHLKKFKFN